MKKDVVNASSGPAGTTATHTASIVHDERSLQVHKRPWKFRNDTMVFFVRSVLVPSAFNLSS